MDQQKQVALTQGQIAAIQESIERTTLELIRRRNELSEHEAKVLMPALREARRALDQAR